jgi:glucose/mannose-6-phosphate isomerase
MTNLDSQADIQKLDVSHCYDSIVFLPDQCESAWNQVKSMELPKELSGASSVVFASMGGSAYGGRIIKALYTRELTVPVDLINDYHLPGYVSPSTLVFAGSYSGGTEETISCIDEALSKQTKLVGISSGGKLAEIFKTNSKPAYVFDPKFNPSGQPRLGQGYMQMGQIGIMAKLGVVPTTDNEAKEAIDFIRGNSKTLEVSASEKDNLAKQLARKFEKKTVVLIGSEFLEGPIHAIRNPFHETGKHIAHYYIIPELNHHLLEGLLYPSNNPDQIEFFMINSDLYSPRIKKRVELTKEVIGKNNISVTEIKLKGPTKIAQVFELIQLGSFISFYLAMIHDVDPAKIPWVDYFKKKLSE